MSSEEAPILVREYEPANADAWDEYVRGATNGTFLHTRRYLGYHRNRFEDRSLLLSSRAGELLAVLPAALDPDAPQTRVVTHPGLTFGGLVYGRQLRGEAMVKALDLVCRHYASQGLLALDYRPVPAFVRPSIGDEDVYALFRLGGVRTQCRLGAVVDLERRPAVDAKYRNMLRKAERAGLAIGDDPGLLGDYWSLLTAELQSRHGAAPVHSLAEIQHLFELFPEEISLSTVLSPSGSIVAGAVTYLFGATTLHAQYLASNHDGRAVAALNYLGEQLIQRAIGRGLRYFSFGPSTEDNGRVLNEGLYQFKYSFGATGVVADGYEVQL